jgi:hypothetical protein
LRLFTIYIPNFEIKNYAFLTVIDEDKIIFEISQSNSLKILSIFYINLIHQIITYEFFHQINCKNFIFRRLVPANQTATEDEFRSALEYTTGKFQKFSFLDLRVENYK